MSRVSGRVEHLDVSGFAKQFAVETGPFHPSFTEEAGGRYPLIPRSSTHAKRDKRDVLF